MEIPLYIYSAGKILPTRIWRVLAISAVSVALALGVAGCSSTSSSASTPETTQGVAYLGKLSNSNVAIYKIAADGSVASAPSAITTSDSVGAFRVPKKQPLLVGVSDGSYQEEATGSATGFQGNTLRAAYLSSPPTLVVSPFTEAIVVDALANGGLIAANLSSATEVMDAFIGGFDPMTTLPSYVAPAVAVTTPSNGNWMAFALGVESQMRIDYGIDHASAVQAIVTQAENGDSMSTCNQGAGNPNADGTITAPQGDNCAFTMSAAKFAANPLNTSGITALPVVLPTEASPTQYAATDSGSCTDRVALLRNNLDLFDSRKAAVQAQLTDFVTSRNWSTAHVRSSWGPTKAVYGPITAPAICGDVSQFRQELIIAIENYWIDHGLNYCHHHIPGWLPPDDSAAKKPKYRNSSNGSTSGGSDSDMTCTANRSVSGAQIVPRSSTSAYTAEEIQWYGVDCSDFTSWVYDFAGLSGTQLQTGIGAQACSVDDPKGSPGVLLDINSTNINDLVSLLKPGDLLLITQVKPSSTDSSSYKEAHVVTWTGKRWSDLQKGVDKDHYDLNHLGEPGSRIGGDINSYLGSYSERGDTSNNAAKLGTEPKYDPWMIIDSHYAGPAYRPFVMNDPANGIKADWYASSLSGVRRIIGEQEAKMDPALKPYISKSLGQDSKGRIVLASPSSGATLTTGNRLIFDEKNGNICQRIVMNP